ncbi:MAG: metalloregulator ArsR/SmtB family transcription factor [Anaerolineae bacterium]
MNESENPSTRRDIVRRLRLAGGMTAQQLAAELHITSMGVRRHLTALEKDGLVRIELQRLPAGRPAYVYQLTEAGYDTFPRNYDLLATQLLDAVQAREGAGRIDELFAGRMDQLVAQYEPRMRGKDLAGRVAELARIQDENGYMAVWEKVEGGYLLKEQNCAIYRVACRFQSACRYEMDLFRRLLDADIERVEHQVKGELTCAYRIAARKPVRSLVRRKVKRTPAA